MKIMVVDDERPIREWLGMTLEKISQYVDSVMTASNGKEAYQKYLEDRPELIITDIRMPALSGLELMEEVKKISSETEFVILTCHEEFAYARKALQMGAREYLLKTDISEEQLTALLENLHGTNREEKKQEDIFFLRQRLIADILERNFQPDKGSLQRAGVYEPDKDYFIAALKVKDNDTLADMKSKMSMTEYQCEYLPYYNNLFVIVWTDKNPSLLVQLNKIQKFASAVYERLGCTVGFSKMQASHEEFASALMQAVTQLNQGFYRRGNIGLEAFDSQKKAFHFEEETARVINGIYLNSRDQISTDIANWLKQVEKDASTESGQFKLSCLKILEKLQDKYKRIRFDKREVIEAEAYQDIENYMNMILAELNSPDKTHGSAYVAKAVDYIENHYGENCSLEQIASIVGLNPEYFSRLFKQNMKQTYNLYLTNLRIEAAKKMLTDTDASISDIAEKAGYQNLAYFSRVFKKITGQTPFEYRK